jgi:AraC-like DNA-binding protein
MDIAERLGFSEPSTFHRAFKKWTGVSPGEYRRNRLVCGPEGRQAADTFRLSV